MSAQVIFTHKNELNSLELIIFLQDTQQPKRITLWLYQAINNKYLNILKTTIFVL